LVEKKAGCTRDAKEEIKTKNAHPFDAETEKAPRRNLKRMKTRWKINDY